MIELKDVSKFYSNNGVTNIGLQNINLKLHRNEIVAITGESGSGKSTLLNVISKIDFLDEVCVLTVVVMICWRSAPRRASFRS